MTSEQKAQELVDALAKMFRDGGNDVKEFTPSVKVGRRYLGINTPDGFGIALQIDVQS